MATQILTKEDLLQFKVELLDEFRNLLKENLTHSIPAKKWLKSYEVRKMLNISPGTLQNLRVNGSLPYTKIGGTLYYESEDVKKMMENNKNQYH